MFYNSTRNNKRRWKSKTTVRLGIAPDGGLFVPDRFPGIKGKFRDLLDKDYVQLSQHLLKLFFTDFTDEELEQCIREAYKERKFDVREKVGIKKVGRRYFLELWHGPTLAFKDMALQILPQLLVRSQKKGTKSLILVATSGDTGKAALEGFRDVLGTYIIVFYPFYGVSEFQKFHMQIQEGKNLNVVGVKGNFDDIQTRVKQIFVDPEVKQILFKNRFLFSSANSINWGRVVPQIIYYIYTYFHLLKRGEISGGERINIVVPTGNFGNILGAYYAKKMGVPINTLICASNRNKVLTEFFRTGVYNANRRFYITSSPSMDILISSNLERLVYDISEGDDQYTSRKMHQLRRYGKFRIERKLYKRLSSIFYGDFAKESEVKSTIRKLFYEYGYLIDPHTAVGYTVFEKYINETKDSTKTVIVSTANPYKFYNTIMESLGLQKTGNMFKDMGKISKVTGVDISYRIAKLKGQKLRFTQIIPKSRMKDFVLERIIHLP